MSLTIVREADLERELQAIRAGTDDPRAGIFGPDSMLWRIAREQLIFLGAGRALILQLAHPWVATAISEHSRTLTDPIGRFHRTFNVMFTMVFGTLDQGLSTARRLHSLHAKVQGRLPNPAGPFPQGSPYWANETSALAWVHATLVDTSLAAYSLVFPALPEPERERYYREARLLARLFGIPEETLPASWADFAQYNRAMWDSDTLSVGADARRVAEALFEGEAIWLQVPGGYRALTAQLLPPRLREGFGLDYGAREQRQAESAIAWVRRIYPALPDRLRFVGPYHEAMARLSGRAGPDFLTRMANRLWIGQPRMDEAGP